MYFYSLMYSPSAHISWFVYASTYADNGIRIWFKGNCTSLITTKLCFLLMLCVQHSQQRVGSERAVHHSYKGTESDGRLIFSWTSMTITALQKKCCKLDPDSYTLTAFILQWLNVCPFCSHFFQFICSTPNFKRSRDGAMKYLQVSRKHGEERQTICWTAPWLPIRPCQGQHYRKMSFGHFSPTLECCIRYPRSPNKSAFDILY